MGGFMPPAFANVSNLLFFSKLLDLVCRITDDSKHDPAAAVFTLFISFISKIEHLIHQQKSGFDIQVTFSHGLILHRYNEYQFKYHANPLIPFAVIKVLVCDLSHKHGISPDLIGNDQGNKNEDNSQHDFQGQGTG